MQNGSSGSTSTKDAFLGLYVTSETKEQVERAAQDEGVSISEAVRRRLDDLDTGGPQPATT